MHLWSDASEEWWKYRTFLPLAERLCYIDPAVASDDFNAGALNRRIWTFIDPRRDATVATTGTLTRDAWLCISVPSSSSHNVWEDGNYAARVMQTARDTDFEIEVKFESGVSRKYQIQGILIEQDEAHFLRLDFHSDGEGTKLFAATFAPGSADTLKPNVRLTQRITDEPDVAPLYMRVRHQGNHWTLSWSYDGVDWSTAVSFRHPLRVKQAGAFAGNVASGGQAPPAHTACLDYFFNTERPLIPEDGPSFSVSGTVVGQGLITMEPAQQRYYLGDIVTLTAVPEPGWSFTGWGGDLSGTDNPAVITVNGNMAVTATFTQDEYTLNVGVDGEGSIAKDPDQPTYLYGASVSLTATADPGWSFAGWSGDLSGMDNPTGITMNDDKVVTATFAQDEYTLDVSVDGEGSIVKDPDQPTYLYDESVSLTATADPGWSFAGWSGDLSGTDNPTGITMDGNKVITGTFTREEYTLNVSVDGEGSVAKDPDQSTYFYGASVSLTATADPGWSFAGWSGDLSGMDNPAGITMDGNKVITGTFTQDEYTLDVSVDGEGSVAKDPDQSTYLYGVSVSLTATADPGWSFAGWSGDLSGMDNPETIVMNGNKDVTAAFAQDHYTLDVGVVGEGTVEREPDQGSYTYGQVVILTAVPDLGATFVGWSGDLSGSTNPDTVTMDASKSVTATFSLEEHTEMGVDLAERTQAVRDARRDRGNTRLASLSGAVSRTESRDVCSSDLHWLRSNAGEGTFPAVPQGSRSGGGTELGRRWDLVSPSQRGVKGLE
jgi:uncharacterized repeat protein (TIGR02543 family)